MKEFPLVIEIVDESGAVQTSNSGKKYSHTVNNQEQYSTKYRAARGRAEILNSRGLNVTVKEKSLNEGGN